ncbi:hypothetical protein PN482_13040 [Microcystis aeruginosa CS-555/01A07]|uniref:hypothetical protein n=1 Tax=Microcystis aeruginosa TaxID=1126 RepID=UPI002331544B|nr:hypothetical protein [Microcystis aeruginosa]MDB9429794.1 hypothetical protein [Microcystis aeruginosa CS-555/01A07]
MAIPIQNTCRLLGEPLSIAEKTDRSHYQLSVISYQLSVVWGVRSQKSGGRRLFLLILPTPYTLHPTPHTPHPTPHFPTSPIHNL